MRYVYVCQFGAVWKLPLDEWKAICERGAQGQGHVLPADQELSKKPEWLHKNRNGGRPEYYQVRRFDLCYREPLDWEPEEYARELQELTDFDSTKCDVDCRRAPL